VPYLTDEGAEIAQGVGGYARPMPIDWMRRQAELVHERARRRISSSPRRSIPGRPAPVLLREETVRAMKPGSVVVDMAIEQGGNCPSRARQDRRQARREARRHLETCRRWSRRTRARS